jgi:hypothetical protein
MEGAYCVASFYLAVSGILNCSVGCSRLRLLRYIGNLCLFGPFLFSVYDLAWFASRSMVICYGLRGAAHTHQVDAGYFVIIKGQLERLTNMIDLGWGEIVTRKLKAIVWTEPARADHLGPQVASSMRAEAQKYIFFILFLLSSLTFYVEFDGLFYLKYLFKYVIL